MKKKQKTLVAIAVGVILVVLALVFSGMLSDDAADPATSDEMNDVNIVIYADEEEVANESFEVEDDTTLMEIMEDNFEMIVSDEGFVEAIEGYEQDPDEGLYWIFEANDEMVEESAEDFVPEDGDIVIWNLMAF
ncbi:protein of unknown function [Alkalibacterium putridalgicola]|uniref:Transcobalamin-like C-terminal domain-containing protein n=1 Tax=Alkalibacterium putridalgicola TaxID=426703 RepID=A0A1H7URK7_9LACT|nr:DUF4430 domain-containing protein [Alkalibacterium putridalgicola]GEK88514.1 hypothetical protein APU01nite_05530 [Alkalibacterium putridalgicola]SEL99308.1 protein of unknown function [Alkalibacterium putridalgicola]